MPRWHIAAEPMRLTSPPIPNPWAPNDPKLAEPRWHYTIQLCRRCGCALGGGESPFGRYPTGAVVEEGALYMAMALHDRAVPNCEVMK